ncbi:hypothetical protein A9Q87_10865 [Flavobacteriales bacterium 34_180_T64]|nr:hypothetical protein A9Q87_10865 [Flavobacteriales bacterium 34_180_T64]
MKNSIFSLILIAIVLVSCTKDPKIDLFKINKQNIGLLTDTTQVKDLEFIFSKDSIVKFIKGDEFTGDVNDIDIYEKGGKKLLSITPNQALDSTAVIETVQILDSRFKTDKNISTLSTFKDINAAYKISRIDNLINSIVISVKEINASFTIDKKELPANLRFDMNMKIEKSQIPDSAKIKYFMLHWL